MQSPAPSPKIRPAAGVGWMVATGLLFVAVTATVKHGAADLPAAQAAFLRYALGLVFVLPMWRALKTAQLSSLDQKIFWFRGLAHALAIIFWFYGMTRITVAEVTAMNYMTPVYITIGAALFLGEKLAARRMIAVAAAFLGALLILRPGFRDLNDGHLAMIFAAMVFAVSYLTAKRLADRFSPSVVVAMLSITVPIMLLPVALTVWQRPSLNEIFWMFIVASFATAGHYTMTLAFRAAPVSLTQPVVFLQLIWSILVGAVLFGENVDAWVVLGGSVIVAATTFIAIREAMLARSATERTET